MRNLPDKIILEVESDGTEIYELQDGRTMTGVLWVIHPDALPAYMEGYLCMNCHQGQKEPMPKECWVCSFPMRDRQLERLSIDFKQEPFDLGGMEKERVEDEEFTERVEDAKWRRKVRVSVPGGDG